MNYVVVKMVRKVRKTEQCNLGYPHEVPADDEEKWLLVYAGTIEEATDKVAANFPMSPEGVYDGRWEIKFANRDVEILR